MSVAVYPGSFDPITNGHLDILERATTVFERVLVGVLANPRKTPLLAVDERIRVIAAAMAADGRRRLADGRIDRVRRPHGRLLPRHGATAIVRGLRAISDFETEMQLAHNNRVLAPDVDTVFFMTSIEPRLRQLEPGQGDRLVRRGRVGDDPGPAEAALRAALAGRSARDATSTGAAPVP